MTYASKKNPSFSSRAESSASWWRTPWMWLVVGGPSSKVKKAR